MSVQRKFRIINELASQNLFIHELLIRPTAEELENYGEADFTIFVAPGFKCIPEIDGTHSEAAIIVDYEQKQVVICGSQYSGEIKKSVFSVMNFLMPKEGVLPMHCSANMILKLMKQQYSSVYPEQVRLLFPLTLTVN